METIDEIGRRAAQAALAEAETYIDVEAGLARVTADEDVELDTSGGGRRRWVVLAAAAAVIAAVAAGVVWARQEPSSRLVPGSPPDVTPAPTTPATTVPLPAPPAGLSVSYRNPPPLLQPHVFATVAATFSGGIAIDDTGIVALDPGTRSAISVTWDGARRGGTAVDAPLDQIAAVGPGPVLYGLGWAPNGSVIMYAVSLTGGRIVAESPLDTIANAFPIGTFGHGPSGIVDRRAGEQVMGYVDAEGRPLDLDGPSPPLFMIDENETVRTADGSMEWPLEIERHPESPAPFAGASPPAPTAGGQAVYWTGIGPPDDPTHDPANATINLIAVLSPDGSGQWHRLPEGWTVAASDASGTILARRVGEQIELATLLPVSVDPPPPTVAPTTAPPTTVDPTPEPASTVAGLAEAIGASTLITREPGTITVFADGATKEVATPPEVYVQTDGSFLWWNNTAATLDGTVVCEVDGAIYRMRQDPDGGYVASWADGDPDEGSALPNYEVDCESGETRKIPPEAWFGDPGMRHIERIGDRTFTFISDAEGNADVTNESGVSVNGEDYAGYHEFNDDGSRVVYGDMTASASPHVTDVVRSRDTTTGELLWSAEMERPVTVTHWYGDRVVALMPTDGVPGVTYEAVIVLDARTGDVITTVPTSLDVAFVN